MNRNFDRLALGLLTVCLMVCALGWGQGQAVAQTDIVVRGAKAGVPVAVPRMCDAGGGASPAAAIPATIGKDLKLSGWFNVLPEESYVETAGKCVKPSGVQFSDWSIIGAEGLVRGEIRNAGNTLVAELYLLDVVRQQPVLGKRYEFSEGDETQVAHRFANEIIGFFTGEKGIFGTRIAFTSKVGRFSELFVMDMDGSNVQQLTKDRGLVYSPSWSPSGDRLLFTSYKTSRPEIYMAGPDLSSKRQLTKDGALKLGTKFLPGGGGLIGSNSAAGSTIIVLYDLQGNLIRRLTPSGGIDVSPSPSPDGGQYAFCSNRSGGPQIYIGGIGGGDVRRISFTTSSYCTSPSWSPKGDQIAFVCRFEGGNHIFLTSPQGESAKQLTFVGNNEDPSWSPDGRYLTFSTNMGRGGAKQIAILPLVSGVPMVISSLAGESNQPSWSPKAE